MTEQFSPLSQQVDRTPFKTNVTNYTELSRTIAHLGSPSYADEIGKKNLPQDIVVDTLSLVQSPDALAARAKDLVGRSLDRLALFYGQTPAVLIPFSGGRDSSSITALTLDLFRDQPDRKVYLVTALPGFSHNLEAPRRQARKIARILEPTTFDPETDHYYMDLSPRNKEFIIDPARPDEQRLGYPGFCSSCKIGMEESLAQAARQLGAGVIAMGYTDNQARQLWPEQSPTQIARMATYFSETFPDLRIGSPLHDIVELPFDSALILGTYGFPFEDHKEEMKCAARATNPLDLNTDRLGRFVDGKLSSMPQFEPILSTRVPEQTVFELGQDIRTLKADLVFMSGVFLQ